MTTPKKSKDYILARNEYILAGILWGIIGMMLKHVTIPSEYVVVCRGMIGAIFIALYIKFRGSTIDVKSIRANWLFLLISGIGLGLNWVFLFASYRYTSVAIGTLCNYVGPILVILLSPFLYKERLTLVKIVCVVMAALGIIFISGVLEGTATNTSLLGIIFGLLSACLFVVNVVFTRKVNNVNVYDKAVAQLIASVVASLPYAVIVNRGVVLQVNITTVVLVVILGIVHTGVAYCFYFRAMGTLPVQTFSIFGYIEPVVAIFVSAIFLKESLTFFGILGAIMILGAVVLSEIAPGTRISN